MRYKGLVGNFGLSFQKRWYLIPDPNEKKDLVMWSTFSGVQSLSCVQLCDPVDCSTPGFPVLHYPPESAQIHVHWVSAAIHPSHPLSTCFSSCLQSFPASGSFPVSWLFSSGSQSIGVSASTSVFPMNIQCWFPLELTDLISLQSKGLSKSFLKHHDSKESVLQHSTYFVVQVSHRYMTTGQTIALTVWTFVSKLYLCFLILCLGLS